MQINTQNVEKEAHYQDSHTLERRLAHALTSLRMHVSKNYDENTNSCATEQIYTETDGNSSGRTASLRRTRELNKRLLASRTREAELQDEVDTLKDTIEDQAKRMCELERQVKELAARYIGDQAKIPLPLSAPTNKRVDMNVEVCDGVATYRNTIKAKDMELESLKLQLANKHHNCGDSKGVSRLRSNSTIGVLPSVSDYFRTTTSPPRYRPIPQPQLFQW